ncbi:nitrite reductase (NAD(P)H) small subunit [Solicola sp. PLA-1-18]|uniref:nitrite reductase (NAD(P)H) small subunit n=1 Tax=Solicola sp. PLA-1-18 TaxID=3380532 RepID=UPI003B80EA49
MVRGTAPTTTAARWVRVCATADLEVDVGVSALVRGKQIALFRTGERTVHAVGNRDPYAGTPTMARGIVGRRSGRPYVAAPAGHQLFDLATGEGLEQPEPSLPAYDTRLVDGHVEVSVTVRVRPT